MDESQQALLRSWVTKSASDLKSARLLGSAEDPPLDTAVYHCQQAAEKMIKAYLVYRGVTPDKTHDVRKLTVQASAFDPTFSELIAIAAVLTPYAWEFRYPDDLAETYPTQQEFDVAMRNAEFIYSFVMKLLPTGAQPKR
jgi:HEPN domain-containing protein